MRGLWHLGRGAVAAFSTCFWVTVDVQVGSFTSDGQARSARDMYAVPQIPTAQPALGSRVTLLSQGRLNAFFAQKHASEPLMIIEPKISL
jgi:hypothetical protein